MAELEPRARPCAQCPYRRDAPSGVWHPEEYEKLPRYDAPTYDQPGALFMCHQGDDTICAGWVGHADPYELLSLRLAVRTGKVAPDVFDYTTTVPLHGSGADAANHGLEQIEAPDDRARDYISKLIRSKDIRP